MDYTVVMVTYNSGENLKKTFESILKQKEIPNELIIIDNNSIDGTIERLLDYKKKIPNFRIFRSKINLGYCKGVNLGVNLSKNQTILVLDHDARLVKETWIEIAFKNLRQNIGVVWGNPGFLNPRDYGEIFISSAFLIKKQIFQEVGMFDEKLFINENEPDLTIRMNRHGYRILPLKKAEIFHPYKPKDARYYLYTLSNRLLRYWKYYPYWIAILMSIFYALQEFREIKNSKFIRYWLKGMRRFFSNLYWIGISYKKRMGLKEFFQSAYQLRFPSFGYKLVKYLYHLKN